MLLLTVSLFRISGITIPMVLSVGSSNHITESILSVSGLYWIQFGRFLWYHLKSDRHKCLVSIVSHVMIFTLHKIFINPGISILFVQVIHNFYQEDRGDIICDNIPIIDFTGLFWCDISDSASNIQKYRSKLASDTLKTRIQLQETIVRDNVTHLNVFDTKTYCCVKNVFTCLEVRKRFSLE